MNAQNRRSKRRNDALKFAYSGPFATLLDSRVGRALPLTKERYTPDSAERYDIGSRVGEDTARALLAAVSGGKSKRRRRRRGGRRVAA